MSFVDMLESLFVANAPHLYWARLPDAQAGDDFKPQVIAPDDAYVVLRMREMSLKYMRKLWRKYYPVLHGFVRHGDREEHQIVGPGQLKDISDANLDRVVNLNQRLAGPLPYRGEDLQLVAGLYSVPGNDAARALIQTVGNLAGLAGLGLGQIPKISDAVKTGVEAIFGLSECRLQLGVKDTRPAGKSLETGIYVGIAAQRQDIATEALWLHEGHLVQGKDPVQGVPLEGHDYFVLEIERRAMREDWAALPGVAEQERRFASVMRASIPSDEKRKQLAQLWPSFEESLASSADLTKPDKARIAAAVAADLDARTKSKNPFETRSVGDEVRSVNSADFDFLDVDVDENAPPVGPNPFQNR